MKILCLYPNNDGYFRCPVGLTLIMTILEKEGHEVKLFDTTFMAAEDNNDDVVRLKSGSVKPAPVSTAHLYKKYSDEKIIEVWIDTIKSFINPSIQPLHSQYMYLSLKSIDRTIPPTVSVQIENS